jgi:hypothetical protein
MSKDIDLQILLLPHFLITLKNNCANSSAEQTSLTILPSWQFEETPEPFGKPIGMRNTLSPLKYPHIYHPLEAQLTV